MFGNFSFSKQIYVLKFRKKGMAQKNITADGRWKGVIMCWGVTVNLFMCDRGRAPLTS